ncbi:hypothetical protein J7L49_04890 [Candidatus Bathyarchaeota archaeon]|nr:hypothetical protein [Candidatus Bathyarchaeota archaeon]
MEELRKEKKNLQRLIDTYLISIDLAKSRLELNKGMALALRAQVQMAVDEILRKFGAIFEKTKELMMWTRISALKTLESSVLESHFNQVKSRYEEELKMEELEKLARLGKILTERERY